jgi:hypothetical protein
VIDVLAVAALVLAWFIFRLERHSRWRATIEAAYGSLRAVQHGIVEGPTSVRPGYLSVLPGHLYFLNGYTQAAAQARANQTHAAVTAGGLDQVFVAPTEALAKLATSAPHEGLVSYKTIAVANFALWKVHVFNQLVQQLTDFNTAHAAELEGASPARLKEIANAAASLSRQLHGIGIGESWNLSTGERGWYGALVDAIDENMKALETERQLHLVHWVTEWPVVVDCAVVGALVGAIVGTT